MAMVITETKNFSIKDIVQGFMEDNETNHVSSMNGRLDIRPKYQRQFVYGEKDSIEVIDSIVKGFPINVMYWVKIGINQAGEDIYEVLDGQQRLISVCHYARNDFSVNGYTYGGMTDKDKFDKYDKLIVYICEGTDEEKLEWFERINKVGKELTKQEMRSAIYFGKGTTKAKSYFISQAKNGTVAYSYDSQNGKPAREYLSGGWDRQEIYETVVSWKIGSNKDEDIKNYMMRNRNDEFAADELWEYFKNVITWVKRIFPTYNKKMTGVEWGYLYNKFHKDPTLSAQYLEPRVSELMKDDEVVNKANIYEYVLSTTDNSDKTFHKLLNLRAFRDGEKISAYESQKHVCPHCMKKWDFDQMEGDHIIPWSNGGKTESQNLQMLCRRCNNVKSNKPYDTEAEKEALKRLLEMTKEEIDALPSGKVD